MGRPGHKEGGGKEAAAEGWGVGSRWGAEGCRRWLKAERGMQRWSGRVKPGREIGII